MIRMSPLHVDNDVVMAIEVALPKTNLVIVSTDNGYIMCGALDIGLLNERLADRGIIAARAVGVKTIEQLLDAPIESSTIAAAELGIMPGIRGKDAIRRMLAHSRKSA